MIGFAGEKKERGALLFVQENLECRGSLRKLQTSAPTKEVTFSSSEVAL